METLNPPFETRPLEKRGSAVDFAQAEAGRSVLFSPSAPGEWMPDTPENRRRFAELGFAWTAPTRAAVWLGEMAGPTPYFPLSLQPALGQAEAFVAAVADNLRLAAASKMLMPLDSLHVPSALLLMEPRCRKISEPVDLSLELARVMVKAELPADATLEDSAFQAAARLNRLLVYRLGGYFRQTEVAVAFVTPLSLKPGHSPTLGTSFDVSKVREVLTGYLSRQPNRSSICFMALGQAAGELPARATLKSSHLCIVASVANGADNWKSCTPETTSLSPRVRDFLDLLVPLTWQTRVGRVRDALESLVGGNKTVERVHQALQSGSPELWQERRSAIYMAFLELADGGNYERTKTFDGQSALVRSHHPPVITKTGSLRNRRLWNPWLLPGVMAIVGFFVGRLTQSIHWRIIEGLVSCYATAVMERVLRRLFFSGD